MTEKLNSDQNIIIIIISSSCSCGCCSNSRCYLNITLLLLLLNRPTGLVKIKKKLKKIKKEQTSLGIWDFTSCKT